MRFTVLNVAYPLAPVGPDAIGGAEQVLTQIDAALVRAGHESIVTACEGSAAAGSLVATPALKGPLDDHAREQARQNHRVAIASVLESKRVDLIHLHGIDFLDYLPPPGVAVVITLHLPPDWYSSEVFHLTRPDTHVHCVSAAQKRACPKNARLLPEIENGVCPGNFTPRRRKRRYALALGRICPEKGFHIALDAARESDTPFALAGKVYPYPAHERYFQEQIVPRLDRHRRFVGEAGGKKKANLLTTARCLLVPSLVPETSSLVAMEALACGTPVVAFPSGSLAEIVEHGKTGFLVQNAREMAEAIQAADQIDPEACRDAAQSRFSCERMTAQYLDMYRRIISKEDLSYAC
jgi:glycosyltransferase involved in cell wall biosynthesis